MKLPRVLTLALCEIGLLTTSAFAGVTTSIPATDTTPTIPAYIAKPDGAAPAPGVLILHGCEGYSDRLAKVADWLASHGYVGIAIDTLAPQGISNACSGVAEASHIEADDARATIAWMRTQPYIDAGHLAVIGYSMGGIAVLNLAVPRMPSGAAGVQAAIAYYPACHNRDPQSVVAPLLILNGDADDWIPPQACQDFAKAAAAAGKAVSITTYPGAKHAFNFEGPDRVVLGHHLGYDATAAADSDVQTLHFLRQYLTASPAP
ncbi:MAG TPA: dienelactone hydrolase family protein [Candidatus Acidoferrales bacterium]|nr:dienelactone hydrolase family protein [Candidatus Acidoferrales bacterium]